MASLPSTAKARVESTLRGRALSSEQELAGTFTGASTMCVCGWGGAGNMTVSKADLSLLHGPHKQALELARITRDEGKDWNIRVLTKGLPIQILKAGGLEKPLVYGCECRNEVSRKMFWTPGGEIMSVVLSKSPLGEITILNKVQLSKFTKLSGGGRCRRQRRGPL